MTLLESTVLVLLGLLAIEQIGAVVIFAAVCLAGRRPQDASYSPRALVVLAVRGADATLAACIRGVVGQRYPDYRVRIVVDSPVDPARAVALQVIEQTGAKHVELLYLEQPRKTCSLKCSAVHQATHDLEGFEVVATVDADIVPRADWLRQLVAPLEDPRVGAAMGNRWYAPPIGQWGSLVVYLWNAAVVVSMYFNRVPWGGSLAVKSAVLRETDLRQRWIKAGCEDVPLFAVLCRLRQKLVFVPSLLMINREESDVRGALRFINRQFVWTRLYHPIAWWGGAILYSLSAATLAAALGLAVAAGYFGRLGTAAALGGAFAGYFVIQAVLLLVLEGVARRLLAEQGQPGCPIRWSMFPGIVLAQALTPLMFLRSLVCRQIEWRGIEYDIRGPWRITMREYRPYSSQGPNLVTPAARTGEIHFPNLLSRVFLKRAFARQFIIPPPPPPALERFLLWYEKNRLAVDLSNIRIDRPIFLIGLHRSGTTLLQDLLCLHPQVGYINNAMPTFRRCFCAAEYFRKRLNLDFRGERMLQDSVEIEAGTPNEGVAFWREWLKEDHHDLEYHRKSLGDFSREEIEQIRLSIRKILWCYQGRATRFFCKNPSLIPHLELLAELFPDARFVHIIRDARTCANSMVKLYRLEQAQLDRIRATGGHGIYDARPYVAFPRLPGLAGYVAQYGADSIQTTARLWNDALDEIERVKDRLPAFYEVRYEDILTAPAQQMEQILEFCQLPPVPSEQRKYWEKLQSVGRVRHSNQYADYETIEALCRDKLKRYGYLSPSILDRSQTAATIARQ